MLAETTAPARPADAVSIDHVGIWGAGFIGQSLARALADQGIHCLLTDIDVERVRRIEQARAQAPVPAPRDGASATSHGSIGATADWTTMHSGTRHVQFVCVSTERNGEIDHRALEDVCRKMASVTSGPKPLTVIIESTISPAWLDTIVVPAFAESGWQVGRDVHIGCSPRRDWYLGNGRTLRTVPKIIGSETPTCVDTMRRIYGLLCERVFVAADARHAAAVKVIENLYRYQSVLLANQLTVMLPDFDVAELLRLASSKWNQDLFHPSFGIGGYCVPLAKDYLAATAAPGHEDFAPRLEATEQRCATEIAERLFPEAGAGRRVVILGLAYAPGLRVHARSPTLRLVPLLKARGWHVQVHDPLYSPDEIAAMTGAEPARFPEDLGGCHAVVLMTGHATYADSAELVIRQWLGPTTKIVDNLGVWRNRTFTPGMYVEVGAAASAIAASTVSSATAGADALTRDLRAWLEEQERAQSLDVLFDAVAVITAIDRPYIIVSFDGLRDRMGKIAERIVELRRRAVSAWSDAEVEGVCALALLGIARVRLEHVELELSLRHVVQRLHDMAADYVAALTEIGEPVQAPARGCWPFELAEALPGLRRQVDRAFHRVAAVDGGTWHRGERFLRRDAVDAAVRLPRLVDALRREPGFDHAADPVDAIRALVRAADGDVARIIALFEIVMRAAADDPELAGDHATLLAPRGTSLERPSGLGREDFMCWVVFRDGFEPRPPLADLATIRRSVHAHHSVKKERIARKYLAKYGPDSRASLEDDLGALGIYVDESAHHRGHQITGIQAALRMLMPIEIRRGGESLRIEGLTDFRLTRTTPGEAARFSMAQYPLFFAYGRVVCAMVESAFEAGVVLPPMIGVR